MRRIVVSLIKILWALFCVGCSEIFVEDISDKELILISPADALVTEVVTVMFWWEETEDIEKYNLQVVHPNFENPQQVLLDTNITGNRFSQTLYPGDFEWRVNGFNSVYETEYKYRTFTIDSTVDLSSTYLVLTNPPENLATQDTFINFKWEPIYNADEYRFILKENNWQGVFLKDTLLKEFSEITMKMEEGSFEWGVRAINEDSESPYVHRKIEIDYTSPQIPDLLKPKDNDTVNTSLVTFQWRRPDRSGTGINDSLIIAKDSTFKEILFRKRSQDTIYSWNPPDESIKEYFWKVFSVDRAGNKSKFSETRNFFRDEE